MFCGRLYAAYACMDAAYRRTLNVVRSTGKKTPVVCICTAGCDRTFGGNPPHRGRGVPKVVNIFAHMQIFLYFCAISPQFGEVMTAIVSACATRR